MPARKKTNALTAAANTSESAVMRSLPDALFLISANGDVLRYLGGAFDDKILKAGTLAEKNVRDVWPTELAQRCVAEVRRALKGRERRAFRDFLQDDAEYEFRVSAQGRDHALLVVRLLGDDDALEISARHDVEDAVTGLISRDTFLTNFQAFLADAKLREVGVAVLCIDIDHFTRINETFGRPVGDSVLKITAQRIEGCLRSTDKLARVGDTDSISLARISGDEFVLVIADIASREDVDAVVDRVRNAFESPFAIDEHELNVTPSMGISMFPHDGSAVDELLKNARAALDEAKLTDSEGREFFTTTMRYRTQKRLDVRNELEWAMEHDQLALHYLPRIELETGYVGGLEALLRWMHPLRGQVPLSELIPLAETTGLINAIGEWVVETACAQGASWLADGVEVPAVSVNLSRREFMRFDLTDTIERAITKAGIETGLLEIEITEDMLLRSRKSEAVVSALHTLGVGIVLDDFGRGHSSIAHLIGLPIKAIKIDRSFVEDAPKPGQSQTICAAIIAMARELGITVVAEGVESGLQLEFLRERGCDAVQGFFYTEPLPAESVPDFISSCKVVADETGIIDIDTVRKRMAAG